MKRKLSIATVLLIAGVLIATTFIPTPQVKADDTYVEIIINNPNPTNQDLEIFIEAEDEISGIAKIILPDETEVLNSEDKEIFTTSYTATENGNYEFKVYDKAGNETVGVAEITTIDKNNPTLELTPSTITLTNQNVLITAKAEDTENDISRIVLIDGEDEIELDDLSSGMATFEAEENGTYIFKAYDEAGNFITEQITVSNINKTKPTITIDDYNKDWTNQDVTITATAKDLEGAEEELTLNFTENGTQTFEYTDKWGNKETKPVTVSHIDKEQPIITIIIGKE